MANFDAPQSRNEAILQNMLGANNEIGEPQSRIEALLIQILETGGGGGGGGTTNYNLLQNKPQIGGVTLQGDKSLADLGIMEVDSALSPVSENAIENKVVTLALNEKLGIVSTMPAASSSYLGKQRKNCQSFLAGYLDVFIKMKGDVEEKNYTVMKGPPFTC